MLTFGTCSGAKWPERRRDENKRQHAAQVRRAPGWDASLPSGSMSIRTAAQRISVKQGELFGWLSERDWIARDTAAAQWTACETATERRWLATRRKAIGYQRHVFQVMVTPLGLEQIQKTFGQFDTFMYQGK
jgi:phage antirepressor YoqD-like protein